MSKTRLIALLRGSCARASAPSSSRAAATTTTTAATRDQRRHGWRRRGRTAPVGTDTPYPPFEIGQPPESRLRHRGDGRDRRGASASRPNYQDTGVRHDLPRLGQGKFDTAAAASTITPEREETVDFTDPYYELRTGAAGRRRLATSHRSTTSAARSSAPRTGTTGENYANEETDAERGPRLPRGPRRGRRAEDRPGRRGDHRPSRSPPTRSSKQGGRRDRRGDPDRTSSTGSRSPRTTTALLDAMNEALADDQGGRHDHELYKKYFKTRAAGVGARGHARSELTSRLAST